MDDAPPKPSTTLAWLAFLLPLFSWGSQVFMALFMPRAPAEVHLLAAAGQALLLLSGVVVGVLALALQWRGGARIIVPAGLGLLISGGTLLLVAVLLLGALLG